MFEDRRDAAEADEDGGGGDEKLGLTVLFCLTGTWLRGDPKDSISSQHPAPSCLRGVPTPHQTSPHMVRGLKNFSQKPPKSFRFWYRGTRDDVYYRLRGVFSAIAMNHERQTVGDGSPKHLGTVLKCLTNCKSERSASLTYNVVNEE